MLASATQELYPVRTPVTRDRVKRCEPGALNRHAGGATTGCSRTSIGQTRLNDLAGGTYQGERGGLSPGGVNARTGVHEAEGLSRAKAIVPVDAAGVPDSRSRYALVSIGMSNTTTEFGAFKQQADADSSKDPHLAIVDGAQGGQTAALWSSPACPCWATLDARLAAAGISSKQVSVAWLKEADASPTSGWPVYAQTLRNETATMLSLLAARFPRLLTFFQTDSTARTWYLAR